MLDNQKLEHFSVFKRRDGTLRAISFALGKIKTEGLTKDEFVQKINDQFEIKSMMKAGASGYLLKDTGTEILEECVRKVLNGGKYFSSDVALTLMESTTDESRRDRIRHQSISREESGLTEREFQVLSLIAREFTNEEIANDLGLSKRTVDSHRQNILRKTNAKNTAGLIKFAFRLGII